MAATRGRCERVMTRDTTAIAGTAAIRVIIIIIIITIPFMRGIHTYTPETNHVSRVHSAAAIPRVLLMVHIALSAILNSFVFLH
jgi:hypothetical protein